MILAKNLLIAFTIFSIISLISSQDDTSKINNQKPESNDNLKFLESKETYDLFLDFITHQGKSYSSIEEFNTKFKAFKENLELVGIKEAEKLPKFIDISKEDFKKKYLNLKIDFKKIQEEKEKSNSKKPRNLQQGRILTELPKSFDWRELGKVSSVKEQGECGVCWAFTSAANLESLYAIKYNKILDLSEEQLLDCDQVNNGCDGGNMADAFDYIRKAGGLMSEKDYKYTEKKSSCKFDKSKIVVKVREWKVVATTDEDEIARILMERGPLSIGINADQLQLHESGIYDPRKTSCPSDNLNHAVLIVGFGEEGGEKYWIIKNSWGENWAENGFFKISRGKGTCGVNQYVVYAKLG